MVAIPKDKGALHFTGIGGIGMSGIAEILHALGYAVQGSDLAENANVVRLRARGIRIAIGHEGPNIYDAMGRPPAVLVYSSAVKLGNPELAAARSARIPVIRRAEMLAELMRMKSAIAIAGTHGKTTTTSLIGAMLESGGFDPTVINGGIVTSYGSNVRLGQSPWMVVEADESDGTFTRLPATVAVVTNIDPEHMDHYASFDETRDAYLRFVENVPFYGYAVLCADHPEVQALAARLSDRRIVSYGFSPQADIRAVDIVRDAKGSRFDVLVAPGAAGAGEESLDSIHLPMLGDHNVENALAAIAVGHRMGMKPEAIRRALERFTGVGRRFTRTGESRGVTVIDDYGHHPVEIAAVLRAGRMAVSESGGRIVAVVQPHRFTRLAGLFEGFCTCFNEADTVIVADVYPAGEAPIPGVNRDALVEGIRRHGHRDVETLPGAGRLAEMVAARTAPGDYVICLGAGDITQWAHALPAALDAAFETRTRQRA